MMATDIVELLLDIDYPLDDSDRAEAAAEIKRLRKMLVWLDSHEPELVAGAEEKFGKIEP